MIQFVIINPTKTESCLLISYKYAFNNSSTTDTRDAMTDSIITILTRVGM